MISETSSNEFSNRDNVLLKDFSSSCKKLIADASKAGILAAMISLTIGHAVPVLADGVESLTISTISNNADLLKNPPNDPYFGLKKGRLLVCKSVSNCISTSSVDSIDKYGRPWEFDNSADEEYDKLLNILNNDPLLKVVESSKEKLYIHAVAKSAVPPTSLDDIEFLINDKDHIITYRSNTRDTIMIYLQTPVTDGGSNINRLESIKRKLGVKEMTIAIENEVYMKKRGNAGLFQVMQEASEPNDVNFLDNSVEVKDEE